VSERVTAAASPTTWALVRTKPSGEMITPEPADGAADAPAAGTAIATTASPTLSTVPMTVWE
jgi:hypothetical protein